MKRKHRRQLRDLTHRVEALEAAAHQPARIDSPPVDTDALWRGHVADYASCWLDDDDDLRAGYV